MLKGRSIVVGSVLAGACGSFDKGSSPAETVSSPDGGAADSSGETHTTTSDKTGDDSPTWGDDCGDGIVEPGKLCFRRSVALQLDDAGIFSVTTYDAGDGGGLELVLGDSFHRIVLARERGGDDGFETSFFPLPAAPGAINVADVDADEHLDLVVDLDGSPDVYLLADGAGGFEDPLDLSVYGTLVAGNVDEFAGDEIVALRDSGDQILVLRYVNGGFDEGVVVHEQLDQASGIWKGDVNDDSILDLLLAVPHDDGGEILLLFGTGTGEFQNAATLAVPSNATDIVIADFTNDGVEDIVALTSTLLVSFAANDGDFSLSGEYPIAVSPASATPLDFDGDGSHDVIVTHAAANASLSFMLGSGDGAFADLGGPSVGISANVAVAPLNGDDVDDFYVTSGSTVFSFVSDP